MRIIHLLVIFFIISNTKTHAQTSEDISIEEKITFASELYNEPRILMISLPDSYRESTKEYPALYKLDGESVFPSTNSDVRELIYDQEFIPEVIVVCIVNNDRDRDMFPPGNETFLQHLKTELIPYIDTHYRTSDFRILCGQSSSGMFTLFALMKEQQLFDAYIAISPSYADIKPVMLDVARLTYLQRVMPKTILYIANGGDEREIDIGRSNWRLLDILLDNVPDRYAFAWKFDTFHDEGHVPESAFFEGLNRIYADE